MEPEQQLFNERLEKIEELKKKGIEPYPYRFDKKDNAKKLIEKYSALKAGEHTNDLVQIAGRIISKRDMGGVIFMHILDSTGKIQLYFKVDNFPEQFSLLNLFDIGDFIGVSGMIFRTKRGELSVEVKKFEMLTKALRALPEKWHGLQDPELRYRRRYLDMISNPEVKEIFEKRAKIIALVREFLVSRGFIEVDTPTLQPVYGGANARPFKTHINAWDMDLYLSISPELYLKRLIIGGFEKVFTICKNFRNEGVDKTHNPEFTMMECYAAYNDYKDMMNLTEDLFCYVCEKLYGSTQVNYQGTMLDFKKPWKRISMTEAIKEYANIDVNECTDKELKAIIEDYKIECKGNSRDDMIVAIFEGLVEEKLIQPTFVTGHPSSSTPLCKVDKDHPEQLERFEPYIMGWEVGNAYSELNDPIQQKKLLLEQAEKRKLGDAEAHQYDEDFILALEHGMPPTGGLGIGIDRMVMLFTNAKSIREVIAFPTMRPENKQ